MMKFFIKNIFIFLGSFLFLLIGLFWINNGTIKLNFKKEFSDEIWDTKVNYFSQFIHNNESINLVLGNSIISYDIIPDSLGNQWFSFANGGQSIYESYKFLDFYKDSITIDTLLIGIHPSDFPSSYKKSNKEDDLPIMSGLFYEFGEDSITTLKKLSFLGKLQIIKDKNYIDFKKIFSKPKKVIEQKVWSKQGYSAPIINIAKNEYKGFIKSYFRKVTNPPNLFYFDLFDSLAKSLNIETIYIIPPKSKYYFINMVEKKYNLIWDPIIDSILTRNIKLWNYEGENYSIEFDNYFVDESHLTNEGSKFFTKLIKMNFK